MDPTLEKEEEEAKCITTKVWIQKINYIYLTIYVGL
jgi:hypothetical protein